MTTKITYHFESDDMPTKAFEVTVDRSMSPRKGVAEWTRLTHHQCENCPLSVAAFTHCPAAVDLEIVVDAFNEVLAHKKVRTIVTLPNDREVHRTGDAGTALGALLGLIMASSPCPILSRLKGLALSHTPFQSRDEQIFRFIGTYLLGQFIEAKQGGEPDWSMDGLKAFLDDIEILNRGFLQRLKSASEENPAMESVRLLMLQAISVRDLLDSWTEEMQHYALPAARRH